MVLLKGNTEGIRNGLGSLFRRLGSGLIIVLVPTVIPNVIKMLVDDYENSDTLKCNACLFYPFQGECDNYIKEYRDSRKQMEFEDIYIFGTDFDNSSLDDVPGDIRDENYKTDKGSYSSDVRSKSSGNAEELLNAFDKMSKEVEKQTKNGIDWIYSNSKVNGTYEGAINNKNYKSNCALGVNWALKTMGALPNDKSFYNTVIAGKHTYGGSMSESDINNYFIAIEGNGRQAKDLIASDELKPGDIVLWDDSKHTNLYAGNNLWYDTGRNFTGGYGSMEDYHFTSFGPFRITFYEDSTVWKILRLK